MNPGDKFALVFEGLLENLFAERMEQNEDISVRFMNDAPFRKLVTQWMSSEAYRRLRSGGDAGAGQEPAGALPPGLRIVEPAAEQRYETCVPLVPLAAAAGGFGDAGRAIDENDCDWVAIEPPRRLRRGMFVAQVVGKSMEPAIPDGAYCLFRRPVEGARQGRTVLVRMRDDMDPESGERYTVKRYESEKSAAEEPWRHARIVLKPINPDYSPIVLTGADEEERFQVVAEVVEVLGG